MKHGGSVRVTARQQTYCASSFKQDGGEVPSPSVLRKASYGTIQLQGTAGEKLERPSQKSYHDLKEIDTIADVSFVSSGLARSTFVKGILF